MGWYCKTCCVDNRKQTVLYSKSWTSPCTTCRMLVLVMDVGFLVQCSVFVVLEHLMKMFKVSNTKSQKLKEVHAFHNRDSIINLHALKQFPFCGPIQSIPYLCCRIKNSPGEVGSWQQIQSDFQTVIRKKNSQRKKPTQQI
jgi:hypothetical protein